jgi:hypothetical protein
MCVVIGIVAIAAFGWVTQLLWNWIVPALFAGPLISFWQALGLLALSKILFSGFGGKGSHKCGHYGHGTSWKQRWSEKFSGLKPEEREAFKKKMMEKWCTPHAPAETGKEQSEID